MRADDSRELPLAGTVGPPRHCAGRQLSVRRGTVAWYWRKGAGSRTARPIPGNCPLSQIDQHGEGKPQSENVVDSPR
jgi:hypothetical protein